MSSCYIYQPQYLGAALSRTNGLHIGDAITGSAGGGAGVLRGDGGLARSTSPGNRPPSHPPPLPQGQLICRLLSWGVLPHRLGGITHNPQLEVTPAIPLPPFQLSLYLYPFHFPWLKPHPL